MPEGTKKRPSQTGELSKVENEPSLERDPKRPTTLPELDIPKDVGSTTGIMRIPREDDDKTSQGDDDQPV